MYITYYIIYHIINTSYIIYSTVPSLMIRLGNVLRCTASSSNQQDPALNLNSTPLTVMDDPPKRNCKSVDLFWISIHDFKSLVTKHFPSIPKTEGRKTLQIDWTRFLIFSLCFSHSPHIWPQGVDLLCGQGEVQTITSVVPHIRHRNEVLDMTHPSCNHFFRGSLHRKLSDDFSTTNS